MLVPQSLAYAGLAGMPAVQGLYAAAFPPLLAGLFASSPYLQTGPVALTSLLTFGALTTQAQAGTEEYVQLGLLLALLVGLARLALGLARGGATIAYLISQPVLLGFTAAAVVLIIGSQLPAALAVDASGDGVLESALDAFAHPGNWDLGVVALAAATVALVLGGARIHPLFPGVLIATVAGIALGASDQGGALVGPIDAGFPPISIDLPWSQTPQLIVPALVIALVGFAEPAAIARTLASRERQSWDPDRELVSQGVANLAAGLSGGFPVGGSFSRSSLNWHAGAQTRWSGLVAGAAVLIVLPVAGVMADLPLAVLAAIVIAAVLNLLRLQPIIHLLAYSKPQFAVCVATLVATLALAPRIDQAVLIGIGLSVVVHLWRERQIDLSTWTEGDTLHLRPRGVLWFASVPRLEDDILACVARHPDVTRLVLHLDALGRIDTTGALTLESLTSRARDAGLQLELADVRPRWRRLANRVTNGPAGGGGQR